MEGVDKSTELFKDSSQVVIVAYLLTAFKKIVLSHK